MATRMLQRRGTSIEWSTANPILGDGEIGFDRTTGFVKIGDGVTAWNDLPLTYIPRSIVDAAGDLIVGTGPDAVARLAKGNPGQQFNVKSDGTLGWEDKPPAILSTIVDAAGDLIVGTGPDAVARLPKGTPLQLLRVNAGGTALEYVDPSSGGINPTIVDAAGDLIIGTANDTVARLAKGANKTVLSVDSAGAVGWDLSPEELRIQRIMTPGVSCPGCRTTAPTALGTGATTLLTVAAGRKYVVKSVVLSNAGSSDLTYSLVLGARNYSNTVTIKAKSILTIDLAVPLSAGETVYALASTGASVYATVTYADLVSTENVFRYGVGDALTSNTWTTLYTAASNQVLTCVTISNYGGGSSGAGLRLSNAGNSILHHDQAASSLVVLSTPLYVPSGAAVQAYDQNGNRLTYTVSGYPAFT